MLKNRLYISYLYFSIFFKSISLTITFLKFKFIYNIRYFYAHIFKYVKILIKALYCFSILRRMLFFASFFWIITFIIMSFYFKKHLFFTWSISCSSYFLENILCLILCFFSIYFDFKLFFNQRTNLIFIFICFSCLPTISLLFRFNLLHHFYINNILFKFEKFPIWNLDQELFLVIINQKLSVHALISNLDVYI